jgi:chitin elicitor receptor kinase 1
MSRASSSSASFLPPPTPLPLLGFLPALPAMASPFHILPRLLLLAAVARAAAAAGDGCTASCDLALGSFYISPNLNLSYIASLFNISDYRTLQPYNPQLNNLDFIPLGGRVNVYFPCRCLSLPTAPASTYLAGSFPHLVKTGQTYGSIAALYNNLTTPNWLQATNSYPENNIPDTGTVNVTVNCSCGDPHVSTDYGLFLTYPLRGSETLAALAPNYSLPIELLRKYNPDTGTDLVYIPVKGEDS